MAKKTTAKQNTNNGESKFKGIRNFFTSERTRFITGLVISIVTIYVGLALISFFFTGGADQSKIENIPLSDLVINRGSVENWTGVRGAFLADLLMNRWFGISSFLILFFLLFTAIGVFFARRTLLDAKTAAPSVENLGQKASST